MVLHLFRICLKDIRGHKIVFVTAYDQFAIKAIKNQAFDYLLKPVNRKELKQCVLRFIERRNDRSCTGESDENH